MRCSCLGKLPEAVTSQVFVAGATGRLGARIVRELLNAGFKANALHFITFIRLVLRISQPIYVLTRVLLS